MKTKNKFLSAFIVLVMLLSIIGSSITVGAAIVDELVSDLQDGTLLLADAVDTGFTGSNSTALTGADVRKTLGISEEVWALVGTIVTLPSIASSDTLADISKNVNAAIAVEIKAQYDAAQKIYTQAYDEAGTNPVSQLVFGGKYKLKVFVRDLPDFSTLSIPLEFNEEYIRITKAEGGADCPSTWTPTYGSVTPIYGYQASISDDSGIRLDNINADGLLLLTMTRPAAGTDKTLTGTEELFVIDFTVVDGSGLTFANPYYAGFKVIDSFVTPAIIPAHKFYEAGAAGYDATYPYYVIPGGMIDGAKIVPITPYAVTQLPIVWKPIEIKVYDEKIPVDEIPNPKLYYHNENNVDYASVTVIDFGAKINFVGEAGMNGYNSAVTWSISPTTAGTIAADGKFTPAADKLGDVIVRATSVLDSRYYGEATIELVNAKIPEIYPSITPPTGITETYDETDGTLPKVHNIQWNMGKFTGPLNFEALIGGNTATNTAGATFEVYLNGSTTNIYSNLIATPDAELVADAGYTPPTGYVGSKFAFTPAAPGVYKIIVKSTAHPDIEDVMYITVSTQMTIKGRVIRTGKQRTTLPGVWQSSDIGTRISNYGKFDEGIKVDLVKKTIDSISLNETEAIIHTTYTNDTDVVTAGVPSTVITANYNYSLDVGADVITELSDPAYAAGTYFLRFSDVKLNDISAKKRGESYMYTEIGIEVVGGLAALDPKGDITITSSVYLVAGSFNSSSNHSIITTTDAEDIKTQIGATATLANQHYNINEYLGVDPADYATVLNFIGYYKTEQGVINLGTTVNPITSTPFVAVAPDGSATVAISNPY